MTNKYFKEILVINVSGLTNIFIKGIKIAIEIDSVSEDKIDKINKADRCFFLLFSKWKYTLFNIFIGDWFLSIFVWITLYTHYV